MAGLTRIVRRASFVQLYHSADGYARGEREREKRQEETPFREGCARPVRAMGGRSR